MCQAQLIKLLMEGLYNCRELAEQTGLHYVTVLQYTRELHEAGAAHICMWQKDNRGRDLIKVYKLGEGKNAKRRSMSPAERQLRYRNKLRQQKMQQVVAGKAEFVDRGNGQVGFEELK